MLRKQGGNGGVRGAQNKTDTKESSKECMKQLTLCIIHKHPRVLLGLKKRGFGVGKWNGFGGKVRDGESIEEAARRETLEECAIEVQKMDLLGKLDFEFRHNGSKLQVHVFKVEEFSGIPKETEEMKPRWFYIDEIPFAHMWRDDLYWFPYFLQGKKFNGKFVFEDENTMISQEIQPA